MQLDWPSVQQIWGVMETHPWLWIPAGLVIIAFLIWMLANTRENLSKLIRGLGHKPGPIATVGAPGMSYNFRAGDGGAALAPGSTGGTGGGFYLKLPDGAPALGSVVEPQERTFVSVDLEYLRSLFEQHTSIQAQLLTASYLGNWTRVSGPFGNAVSHAKDFVQVWFEDAHMSPNLNMYFHDDRWIDCLLRMRRGDALTVLGQIKAINAAEFMLDNCELAEPE